MRRTLFNLPAGSVDDVIKGTVAIIGAPITSVKGTKKAGIDKAPSILRKLSLMYSGIVYRDVEISLFERDIIDLGDFNAKKISRVVSEVIRRGGKVVVIGGDHSITYLSTRDIELSKLLWLDAHLDIGTKGKLDHSNVLRHIINRQCDSRSERRVEISVYGFRGYSAYAGELNKAINMGVRIIKKDELPRKLCSFDAISLDLDFFSAEFFGSVLYPELRGESPSSFINLLRKADLKVKYFDVVEYAPKLDPSKKDGKIVVQLLAEILASL